MKFSDATIWAEVQDHAAIRVRPDQWRGDGMTLTDAESSMAEVLAIYDRWMGGGQISADEDVIVRRLMLAGAFASAAYEDAGPGDEGAHAMLRSFLIALSDPTDPQLDYLRAWHSPFAGARRAEIVGGEE